MTKEEMIKIIAVTTETAWNDMNLSISVFVIDSDISCLENKSLA